MSAPLPPIPTDKPEELPWYVAEPKTIAPEVRDLFEKYSKVPADQVVSHITHARNKAFKVFPFPCLGRFGFLDLSISQSSRYNEILERLKNGDTYLDIGCCVGQDIRKLVFDGALAENMYGSDLQQAFMDIGYELFLDKDNLKTTFIAADVLDEESDLTQLHGRMDVVHAASFFHLFNWDEQVRASTRVARLLKPRVGSLVVGRQVGNVNPGPFAGSYGPAKTRYQHDSASFARLWKQIGDTLGFEFQVEAHLEGVDISFLGGFSDSVPKGTKWLKFVVQMV